MTPLRVVFIGTAELACASLRALCRDRSFQVAAAVTQPDRPAGRELKLQFSPVKQTALTEGVAVLQPERARSDSFVHQLRELRPDLIVVAAYGQILPQAVLDVPRFGALNVHTSLLPKYRGAAPIQWAILNDESETGVTIMKMDAGLDTGPILTQAATAITASDNAQTLHDRLASLGADLLMKTIPRYVTGAIIPRPQPKEHATYARKIAREDGRLDWTQPVRAVWNRVRGLTPWPGAFTFQSTPRGPRLLKIWSAEMALEVRDEPGKVIRADKHGLLVACENGGLRLLEVQREGGRRLSVQQFIAGGSIKAGERFA